MTDKKTPTAADIAAAKAVLQAASDHSDRQVLAGLEAKSRARKPANPVDGSGRPPLRPGYTRVTWVGPAVRGLWIGPWQLGGFEGVQRFVDLPPARIIPEITLQIEAGVADGLITVERNEPTED